MKYVRKIGAPSDYRVWCNQVRGTANENYRCLLNPEKQSLHRALLKEQGWLCAYTMRQVEENSSHIEHIKPESVCRLEKNGLDLEYKNLVACFPRDGMGRQSRYGAQLKDRWWDNNGTDFVSPLQPNCESYFRFHLDGTIDAVGNRRAGATTIKVLGLDHGTLAEDRKLAIEEFIYGSNGVNPVSVSQAGTAIRTICKLNSSGRFYQFCVAIRDALTEHIQQMTKLRVKRRFQARR